MVTSTLPRLRRRQRYADTARVPRSGCVRWSFHHHRLQPLHQPWYFKYEVRSEAAGTGSKIRHLPLYRYNPVLAKEGKNPLQLDYKEPSVPVKDFAYNESRFRSLVQTNEERAEMLLKESRIT
jgi:pyruvate/2-oxoacid:ferredoxin oxidoreductase beta subunit